MPLLSFELIAPGLDDRVAKRLASSLVGDLHLGPVYGPDALRALRRVRARAERLDHALGERPRTAPRRPVLLGDIGLPGSLQLGRPPRGVQQPALLRRVQVQTWAEVPDLARRLAAMPEVSRVYPWSGVSSPEPVGSQGYLDADANLGMDVRGVWSGLGVSTAPGAGVHIGVVELASPTEVHPDLPPIVQRGRAGAGDPRHALKTLGVLVAGNNDLPPDERVDGIVWGADRAVLVEVEARRGPCAISEAYAGEVAAAIHLAAAELRVGGVLLVEVQLDTATGHLPIYLDPLVRQAIAEVEASGVLVVVPSSNSSVRLGQAEADPFWAGQVDMSVRGLLVGGAVARPGAGQLRVADCGWGPQVHCCAWASGVRTLGPGGGAASYSGTSAAAAIIAGAAGLVQAVAWKKHGRVLLPDALRDLLAEPAAGRGVVKGGGEPRKDVVGVQPKLKGLLARVAAKATAGIPGAGVEADV